MALCINGCAERREASPHLCLADFCCGVALWLVELVEGALNKFKSIGRLQENTEKRVVFYTGMQLIQKEFIT